MISDVLYSGLVIIPQKCINCSKFILQLSEQMYIELTYVSHDELGLILIFIRQMTAK